MFVYAVKIALVESLREAYDVATEELAPVKPSSINIEYPLDEINWPALLVQFRPNNVAWTGLNPNEYTLANDEADYGQIRRCQFEGSWDVTFLALTSAERDQISDTFVEMILMNETTSTSQGIFNPLHTHDLVSTTVLPSTLSPIGDSIGPGTPWNPDVLTYEASWRLTITGQFFADAYNRRVLPLSDVTVHPYRDDEEPFGEDDGLGQWRSI